MRGCRDPSVRRVEDKQFGGKLNPIPSLQRDASADRSVPDERAVLAPEVFERRSSAVENDVRVPAGDAWHVEPDG